MKRDILDGTGDRIEERETWFGKQESRSDGMANVLTMGWIGSEMDGQPYRPGRAKLSCV